MHDDNPAPPFPLLQLTYHVRMAALRKEAAMEAETIAGLIGLGVGVLVLIALSVFESRNYRREHGGESMTHHWLAEHHMLDWMRRKH